MKNIFITLIIFIASLTVQNIKAQVLVSDSLALVDMYNSMNGPNWYIKDNWLQGPISRWYGISSTGNRVTGLHFGFNNNMQGSLTNSIGNLTELKTIDFNSNNISGGIPSSFSRLTKLESMDFGGCHLSGSIPSFLGRFPNLYFLDLRENALSGHIPSSIGANQNLRYVMLGHNQLTGSLPASFGTNPNLEILNVGVNQLSGPVADFMTTHLTNLFLGGNSFTGPIPDFHLTPWIDECDLSHNQFSGSIPEWLGNMTSYSSFVLSYNNLTGEIPRNLGNLQTYWIDLSHNKLSGNVPSTLENRPLNSLLYLNDNNFTFQGLDTIISNSLNFIFGYSPQSVIPIHFLNQGSFGKLSVFAGGTLSNNTYKWYRNNLLYKTIIGDSSFILDSSGSYYVIVSNSIVTNLVLNSDTIVITEPCVTAPLNLTTTNVQSNTVTLSWTPSNGAIQYQLKYKPAGGAFVTVNSSTNSVVLRGLQANTKYIWKVRARCTQNYSPFSANNTFKTSSSLVTSDNSAIEIVQQNFSVSPNPASDYIEVNFYSRKQENYTVQLFDMQGKLLIINSGSCMTGNNAIKISVSSLIKGMYILKLTDGNQSVVSKFTKL